MRKYKLTNQNMKTHNGFKWELNKKYKIDPAKTGTTLCSDQVFHFYDSPELAILLNSIHTDIGNPRLFQCTCDQVTHDGLKGGAKWMMLKTEISIPKITINQKIAFGIYCAGRVYKDKNFRKWAKNWLANIDRSAQAASDAADAAAAHAAADAAHVAQAASDVAQAAAYAADAAVYVAHAAAAHAAADAAHAKIDFKLLAKKAMKIK